MKDEQENEESLAWQMAFSRFSGSKGFNTGKKIGQTELPPAPPLPKISTYTFNTPDSEDNIIIGDEGVSIDAPVTIKAGTLEKLVERLTYEHYFDPIFTQTFLLTYRTFTTPNKLLNLLIARYHTAPKPNISSEEWEGLKKSIRLRVFNTMRLWVMNGFYDFVDNPKLCKNFINFVTNDMSTDMNSASSSLLKVFERQVTESKKNRDIIFGNKPPKSILPKVISANPRIMDINAEEIARQLTLIESKLYRDIKPWECLNQCWARKDKDKKAPRIIAMINRFNQVSKWIASEILREDNLKTRVAVLKHAIDIAYKCLALNNFNAVMEIISGLHTSALFRLKQTWNSLSSKSEKHFEECKTIMCRDQNFKTFRNFLHSVNPPLIPYLGVYLTDLTFIEDGNYDMTNGLINFVKRQQVSQVISEIQQYQHTPYCLEPVEELQSWLLSVDGYSENEMFQRSLEIEPREKDKLKKKQLFSKKHANGVQDPASNYLMTPYGELEEIRGYKFYERDSPSNLNIENDESGTRVIIKGGTLTKLVERLTFEQYPDPNYVAAFLLSYRLFTTASELLNLLIMRFNLPHPKNPTKEQEKLFNQEKVIPIHFRVINVLKLWTDKYIIDFRDTVLVQRIIDFITSANRDFPVLQKAGSVIISTLQSRIDFSAVSLSSYHVHAIANANNVQSPPTSQTANIVFRIAEKTASRERRGSVATPRSSDEENKKRKKEEKQRVEKLKLSNEATSPSTEQKSPREGSKSPGEGSRSPRGSSRSSTNASESNKLLKKVKETEELDEAATKELRKGKRRSMTVAGEAVERIGGRGDPNNNFMNLLKKKEELSKKNKESKSKKKKLLSYSPKDVAEQIFCSTYTFIQNIDGREFIYKGWEIDRSNKSPKLSTFYKNMHSLRTWIKSEIFTAENSEICVQILHFFILMAHHLSVLCDYHDFHLIFTTLDALKNETQLKILWDWLPFESLSIWQQLCSLDVRDILSNTSKKKSKSYLLPVFEYDLHQLIQYTNELDSLIENDFINFEPILNVYSIFSIFTRCQATCSAVCEIKPNKKIQEFLRTQSLLSDDDLATALNQLNLSTLIGISPAEQRKLEDQINAENAIIDNTREVLEELMMNDVGFHAIISEIFRENILFDFIHPLDQDIKKFNKAAMEQCKIFLQSNSASPSPLPSKSHLDSIKELAASQFPDHSVSQWEKYDENGEVFGNPANIQVITLSSPSDETILFDACLSPTSDKIVNLKKIFDFYSSQNSSSAKVNLLVNNIHPDLLEKASDFGFNVLLSC